MVVRIICVLSCALLCFFSEQSLAIDINPENQVGPAIERWGWDIKGSQNHTNTSAKAELLYDAVPANLVRIPIFVNAHFSNGAVDTSIYSNEITSIQNILAVNPSVEVFASVKLQGGDSFVGPASEPDWVTQGTATWPTESGTIFGNSSLRPNPEFYSELVADFFDYFANQGIEIDYLGVNNETDGALNQPRYIDTVDRLNVKLASRGYDTSQLSYVGAEAFSPTTTRSILNTVAGEGRLDTVDIVGSHQYYGHSNHTSDLWQDFSTITGGTEMWHTEVHMNASNSNNGGSATDNISRMRGGMGIAFSANMNGVSTLSWWGGGDNTNQIDDTLKREIVKSTLGSHPVESPNFDEQDNNPDAALYQAYRQGDLLTLWIAHPEFSDENSFPVDFVEGIIATEGSLSVESEYWQGGLAGGTFGNEISAANTGSLSVSVNGDQKGLVIGTVPENSISKISIVMTGRLVWNQGTGNFDEGFARSNGFGEVGATGLDPFGYGGTEALYIGNGGVVTLDDSTSTTGGTSVNSMVIGTNSASDIIADRNGFGVFAANDSVSLTVGDGTVQVGDIGNLTVGDGGQQALATWNSSGILEVEGKLRVGKNGGMGQFTQNDGVVLAGTTGGSSKFIAIGEGLGSDGTYQLNQGAFLPGGGLAGSQFRELRVGSATTGQFLVGDGIGNVDSARVETRWQIYVGHDGGDGELAIESDGTVTQSGSTSSLYVGHGGGQGTVTQSGGTFSGEHHVRIGSGVGSIGHYNISAGLLDVASDGSGELRIGENGANGTLVVQGTATVNAGAELIIADTDNASTTGLLEIIGSGVSLSVGKLDNALGNEETLRWVADSVGVSPLVVRGDTGATLFVELQHPTEISLSSGGVGDGIALDLDLSALELFTGELMLIENLSSEMILGLFENPEVPTDLYDEGESITGTGYNGTVSISYLGGTGNDVVLNLSSGDADFDSDLDVDGVDFLTWQRGLGSAGGLSEGDADGNGTVDQADFIVWQNQFGLNAAVATAAVAIPEPASAILIGSMVLMVCGRPISIYASRSIPRRYC